MVKSAVVRFDASRFRRARPVLRSQSGIWQECGIGGASGRAQSDEQGFGVRLDCWGKMKTRE